MQPIRFASQYVKVKAVRHWIWQAPQLKDIQIMGPEDLFGGDAYGMWEYDEACS